MFTYLYIFKVLLCPCFRNRRQRPA